MTDKQIIIDGVDCRYWFRPNPTDYRKCSLRGQDDNCDEIKDCFVKELLGKLAHKEQECEELKKCLLQAQNSSTSLNKQLDQLKAGNDELKEKVKELRQGWINCDNERNLQEANSEFRQRVINRYKQTLTEIREIASKVLLNTHDLEQFKDADALFGALLEIHKKISECEENNE